MLFYTFSPFLDLSFHLCLMISSRDKCWQWRWWRGGTTSTCGGTVEASVDEQRRYLLMRRYWGGTAAEEVATIHGWLILMGCIEQLVSFWGGRCWFWRVLGYYITPWGLMTPVWGINNPCHEEVLRRYCWGGTEEVLLRSVRILCKKCTFVLFCPC